MRIYEMTATFGKLDHQTLTLKPDFHIITAPNEWGKSTWCAFLIAMFYGIDSRECTNDIPDYTPWTGHPMEGRIDLRWNERDITIERKTKGHIPMGDFTAYETHSGLPVPELTAANCGQVLLGVEESVFRRSAFIRQTELPVTADEALYRRLNSLATTGEENSAADNMASSLRELRSQCRYHRSGLIPQAESQRDTLQEKLTELDSLDAQCQKLQQQMDTLRNMVSQLHNHRQTMDYTTAQVLAQRIAQAQEALASAQTNLQALEETCKGLPTREEIETRLSQIQRIGTVWNGLQAELAALPEAPRKPFAPPPFAFLPPEGARKMLQEDTAAYVRAKHNITAVVLVCVGVLGLLSAAALFYLHSLLFAGIAGVLSLGAFLWGLVELIRTTQKKSALLKKYGSADHTRWALPLTTYERRLKEYNAQMQSLQTANDHIQNRLDTLRSALQRLCGATDPEGAMDICTRAAASWDAYDLALRETERAQSYLDTMEAMAKPVSKPAHPDNLTHSEADTDRLLSKCAAQQQELEKRLGQYRMRMVALGSREELQQTLTQKQERIAELEKTYSALTIALDTLEKAKADLQQRFAPKILKRTQLLLSVMTGGKYQTIAMDPQFSFRVAAQQEDSLRDLLCRSDGTIDQLYLALRLAVAEELTPDAPLILDDALVRFDDQRAKATLSILREMGKQKQVILFTCQQREETL